MGYGVKLSDAEREALEKAALLKRQKEIDEAAKIRQNYARIAREKEKAFLLRLQEETGTFVNEG